MVSVQEFDVWVQTVLEQEKLQAPLYPLAQEPALEPEAVDGRAQLPIVVAAQVPADARVQEFDVWVHVPFEQEKLQAPL